MHKKCVLFVDDESTVLSDLKQVLDRKNDEWELVFAKGGHEARKVFSGREVDVVVSDHNLSGNSGAELLEEIAEEFPDTVRLMYSGIHDPAESIQITSSVHQMHRKHGDTVKLMQAIEEAIEVVSEIDNSDLRRQITRTGSSGLAPEFVPMIRKLIVNDQERVHEICDSIGTDVGIASKVMQLLNSSFFGSGTSTPELRAVCEQLDERLLHELFEQTGRYFCTDLLNERSLAVLSEINHHSVAVASLARTLAAKGGRETLTRAHLSGMLHDIGKAVMLQTWPDSYLAFEESNPIPDERIELEELIFGTTHPEVGSQLLRLWGIHHEIVEVTRFHHSPEQTQVSAFGPLAAVYLVDMFLSYRNNDEALMYHLNTCEFLERLGGPNQVGGWLDELYELVE